MRAYSEQPNNYYSDTLQLIKQNYYMQRKRTQDTFLARILDCCSLLNDTRVTVRCRLFPKLLVLTRPSGQVQDLRAAYGDRREVGCLIAEIGGGGVDGRGVVVG